MIQECLEIFQKNLREKGERFFLDAYTPKDGTYLMIRMKEGEWEVGTPLDIIYQKKSDEILGKEDFSFSDFCCLDYYSKLIAMNKPIDSKKIIHSNNYYTFFVKKESFTSGKLTDEIIDGYYEVLREPRKKYQKKNVKKLYEEVEKTVGKVNEEELNEIAKWVKTNIRKLPVKLEGKDYLKLFFVYADDLELEKTKAVYQRESSRYTIPNIYNNNDYNLEVNGEILGLPNDNLGMNSKKPYLANRSRRVQMPYLLGREDVLLQAKFYDYLMGQASKGRVNIYFNFENGRIIAKKADGHPPNGMSGYYLRLRKGMEVEIHNADTIIRYNSNLNHTFWYQNILDVTKKEEENKENSISDEGQKKKKERIPYGPITQKKDLEYAIDDIFFGKSLIPNYFTNPGDMTTRDGLVKNQIIAVRDLLFAWFYKDDETQVWPAIGKVGIILMKHSISCGYWNKAGEQLNLLWSMEEYFCGGKERKKEMEDVREALWKHLNQKEEWSFGSDKEYYFAVGQLVSYFINKSRAGKKPLSFANIFLNAANDRRIKEQLNILFKKYNYDMEYNRDVRGKNLFGHAMLYQPQGRVDMEMIAAGLTVNNLIYRKKEEDI